MDGLEHRLREVFADDRLSLAPAPGALDLVHNGVRRRHRRRVVAAVSTVAAASLATVAVAIAVPAALTPHRSPGTLARPAVQRPWSVGTATALPPGLTAVTALVASGPYVWAAGPGTLVRLSAGSGVTHTFPVDGTPESIAATPHQVWVATRRTAAGAAACVLEQRTTDGVVQHSYRLPCSPGGGHLALTANGLRVWVVGGDGAAATVRVYDGQTRSLTATRTIAGAPTGDHPFAIGDADVFVMTRRAGAVTVARLSGPGLTPAGTMAAPAVPQKLVYGSHRVFLADPTAGVFAMDPAAFSSPATAVAPGPALDVTTGNDLLWALTQAGPDRSELVARDARTGQQVGDVVLAGRVLRLVADRDAVWTALQRDGQLSLVAIRPG